MRTFISNGLLVRASGRSESDVVCENGTVTQVVPRGTLTPADGDTVIDAKGCYVVPGAVDAHVHMQLDTGSTVSSDTFETGTIAAAFGGTTTIVDFAEQRAGGNVLESFEQRMAEATSQCVIDWGLHQVLGGVTPQSLVDARSLVQREGVSSIKLFMAYPGRLYSDDGQMLRALQMCADTGMMAMVHAENGLAIDVLATPGHRPDAVSLLLTGPDGSQVLASGDVLFAGSVGRTDLEGGDWSVLQASIETLLAAYPGATVVHPGGQQASPHAFYNRGKEITIKNFTVTGGLDGIHLSGPASAVLDGNVVVDNKGRGIHIDKGSIARVLNNRIEGNGVMGISVTGTSYAYIGVFIPRIPALSPNTIRNNAGPGIQIERSSGAWVVGNTISGNKHGGIVLTRNAHADVMGNTISANGGDGVNVSFGSGVNFDSEPRKDGPNQTAAGQANSGVALRCLAGGYVDGPLGTLAGAQGGKVIEGGCVDRVTGGK